MPTYTILMPNPAEREVLLTCDDEGYLPPSAVVTPAMTIYGFVVPEVMDVATGATYPRIAEAHRPEVLSVRAARARLMGRQ